MPKLSIDLVKELQTLADRFGLEPKEERYDEASFGNAYIVLTSREFAMRILRDRGQIFVDLAKSDLKWVGADKKVEALGLHPRPESPLTVDQLIEVLENNRERILQSL
jgi:hypothetical protein